MPFPLRDLFELPLLRFAELPFLAVFLAMTFPFGGGAARALLIVASLCADVDDGRPGDFD